jgi:hypothetical protein
MNDFHLYVKSIALMGGVVKKKPLYSEINILGSVIHVLSKQ